MGTTCTKLLKPTPYSCYELGHTWNPSCTGSSVEVGLTCLEEAVKIYSSVYFVSLLLRGKVPNHKSLATFLKNVFRSSAFLSYNGFYFIVAFCTLSKLKIPHNYYSFGLFSSWIASFLAIFVEREHRRSLLATYVSNVATESLLLCLPDSTPKIPHAEKILFGIVSSILLYLYRLPPPTPTTITKSQPAPSKEPSHDFIFSLLRFLLGPEEKGTGKDWRTNSGDRLLPALLSWKQRFFSGNWFPDPASNALSTSTRLKNILTLRPSPNCPHQGSPCLVYVFKGFVLPFLYGTLGQMCFRLLKRKSLMNMTTLKPGLFLGSFCGLYKFFNCVLRGPDDYTLTSIPSGFMAGIFSSLFFSSKSLSLYLFWKTIEVLCRLGVSNGAIPNLPFAVEILYASATSILFHLAVVRPHQLKPSYFKFMNRITGDKVTEINRFLLDHEYPNISEASKVIRHVPNYDFEKLSPHMQVIWPIICQKNQLIIESNP